MTIGKVDGRDGYTSAERASTGWQHRWQDVGLVGDVGHLPRTFLMIRRHVDSISRSDW
jgi:hypothetical protein